MRTRRSISFSLRGRRRSSRDEAPQRPHSSYRSKGEVQSSQVQSHVPKQAMSDSTSLKTALWFGRALASLPLAPEKCELGRRVPALLASLRAELKAQVEAAGSVSSALYGADPSKVQALKFALEGGAHPAEVLSGSAASTLVHLVRRLIHASACSTTCKCVSCPITFRPRAAC